MNKKQRFEELMLKINSSLSKIRESKLDSIFLQKVVLSNEISDIKKMIEKHSDLNEQEYYKETNDIPTTNSFIKYYEMSKMFELVFDLFSDELIKNK